MTCRRCGNDDPADTSYCGRCGERLRIGCASCGTANPATNRFCHACGGQLPIVRPDSAAVASPPTGLASAIAGTHVAVDGERKRVTVLFADVKSSLELIAERDPEEARAILDGVLDRMVEAVQRYEGTVNNLMGDGIMAIFGAPIAHEDHALRACYAALDMQSAIRMEGEELRRRAGVEPQIRVGLNSGEVVIGTIATGRRIDYTAVGHTTHLAARMEQLALPGSIRMTVDTFRLVEGFVEAKPLGPVPVKGLAEPVEIYDLAGARVGRRRIETAAARGFTRFVGRQVELALIHRALEQARSGRGQLAAIVGEPGVGKSRLLWEVTHSPAVEECLVLECGAQSYTRSTPYVPLVGLLKAYCGIVDGDAPRTRREKVAAALRAFDGSLDGALPPFLDLLDAPVDDPRWAALEPSQRRLRTTLAFKQLLHAEARTRPVVVVVEDLHWIDSETQSVLDGIAASLPAAPILLLVDHRPEYEGPWTGKSYYTLVRLDVLPAASADELLDGLLGPDEGLATLKRRSIERTEGNPFFLEEYVRSLVEAGALVGTPGSYRLADPSASVDVPTTVQSVLAARIDRLPPDEKRLLQTAAVIGKNVPFGLLAAIAHVPAAQIRASCTRLQEAEFLYEVGLFPEPEYTFKHALTHDVAYAGLLRDHRKELHARIVDALEALPPERFAENVETLAHHAVRADLWEKAARYLREAGLKAGVRANREAAAYFVQALEALEHVPAGRGTLELAVDLRLDLRGPLMPLGELDEIVRHLREAERAAEALGDEARIGWTAAHMSGSLFMTGRLGEARSHGDRAREIAGRGGDARLGVFADLHYGAVCVELGDFDSAGPVLDRLCLAPADLASERVGPYVPAVMARSYLARLRGEQGEFDRAIELARDAQEIADRVDHPLSRDQAHRDLGYLYTLRGDPASAIDVLERGTARGRAEGESLVSATATGFLGYAYVLAGDVSKGLALLRESLAARETMRAELFHSLLVTQLAHSCLLAALPDEAEAAGERALALARDRGEQAYEAWALRTLGEIDLLAGGSRLDRAERRYDEALVIAARLGMRPLQAQCLAGIGRLRSMRGDAIDAAEKLRAAGAMFEEMRMAHPRETAGVGPTSSS